MNRWAVVAVAVTFLAGCGDATTGPVVGPELPLHSPLFSHAAAGTWTNTPNLSVGRHFLAAAAASSDGRVFVSGGLNAGAPLKLVEAYNPAADAWSEVAPLPGDRFAHASVRAGDGRIYVIGGITGGGSTLTNSVESYDVSANSWTSVTSMSVVRGAPAAAVAGGKIYVTGGQSGPGVAETSGEVYDPAIDTWTPIASMATPRSLHALATGPDGRVYAIGGTNFNAVFIASVEAYDPETNTWTEVASLPSGRQGLGAATAADGHIYAYGGEAGNLEEVESTVFSYDVATDTWNAAPSMNQARFGFAATAGPDGRIYAVAGVTRAPRTLNSAEWYLPVVETTVMVAIDIKPGSDVNPIDRNAAGKVPVALLSSSSFDATTVDRSTVVFAGAPALPIGGGSKDVNGDGLADVVLHFATQALTLPDGTTQACLTGQTTDGTNFEGCDAVVLVNELAGSSRTRGRAF